MKREALRVVLRAFGVKNLTPAGVAVFAWQVLGARAVARRQRRERLRKWSRERRVR